MELISDNGIVQIYRDIMMGISRVGGMVKQRIPVTEVRTELILVGLLDKYNWRTGYSHHFYKVDSVSPKRIKLIQGNVDKDTNRFEPDINPQTAKPVVRLIKIDQFEKTNLDAFLRFDDYKPTSAFE